MLPPLSPRTGQDAYQGLISTPLGLSVQTSKSMKKEERKTK